MILSVVKAALASNIHSSQPPMWERVRCGYWSRTSLTLSWYAAMVDLVRQLALCTLNPSGLLRACAGTHKKKSE